jgi:hypothetical protein
VNFPKDRVSKAAAFTSLALTLSLLVTAPAPEPLSMPAARAPLPAAAAQLESVESNCAEARRELRFEMISDDAQAYPPPGRSPVVCLAVYSVREGRTTPD